ncbi:MAG: phytoene desaturase family protein [Deltaproteobacteria bacterium]|jgi:phytoene dehydrogenase-like protein
MSSSSPPVYDAIVIGAGFGGLGAALGLAERGARVCLLEALRYPGGCASTFTKVVRDAEGHAQTCRFDAGATVVSGLAPHQLFGRWLTQHAPEVEIEQIDPLVTLRAPSLELVVRRDRDALVAQLAAASPDKAARVRAFFEHQRRIADLLWEIIDDPDCLPPLDLASVLRHAARAARYVPLLGLIGRPLASVLARHELTDHEALRVYLDALCQITVQCPAAEAEAPFALGAMDYYHRGTGHVRGGFGRLADALVSGCRKLGVDVRFSTRAHRILEDGDGYQVLSGREREPLRARAVVANLVPDALAKVSEGSLRLPSVVETLGREVRSAWGAVMLYAVARPHESASDEAAHLELVDDTSAPFMEGNHVFVSISSAHEPERAPAGRRVITMSTHVRLEDLDGEPAPRVEAIQARMRSTLAARAPEWAQTLEHILPASPRTFERFTGRARGAVGGIPRRAGLAAYARLGPVRVSRRLYLVGDSVFPGQSALATATGGVRVAEAVRRDLS